MQSVTPQPAPVAVVRTVVHDPVAVPAWPRAGVAWTAVAALATAVLFAPALSELWRSWTQRPEYGFGLFIPPLSLVLIWQRRHQIAGSFGDGSPLAYGFMAGALGLRLAGELALANLLMGWGLVLAIAALSLATIGRQATRAIAAPIGFLVFMLPLPEFLLQSISQRLQLLSSALGVEFIRAAGVSVYLEGNVIDLGPLQLQVAEACSGLRYLLALLVIGFIAAWCFRGPRWQRLLICLTTVPITVLMNSLRIALAGIGAERYGVAAAEGVLHAFEGIVVFMGCIALLAGEMALLSRFAGQASTASPVMPRVLAVRRRRRPVIGGLALVLCAVAIAGELVPRPQHPVPARIPFAALPLDLDEYRGTPRPIDASVRTVLAADDLLLTDYLDSEGRTLNLYTQYYERQDRGAATHSPRLCIPAAGWEIAQLREHRLDGVRFHGMPLAVNRALVTRAGARLLVYYWFQQRGRNTTDEYLTKLLILRDGLVRQRTDGAMVRIITPLSDGEPEASGDARLGRFAARLLPRLERHIPS